MERRVLFGSYSEKILIEVSLGSRTVLDLLKCPSTFSTPNRSKPKNPLIVAREGKDTMSYNNTFTTPLSLRLAEKWFRTWSKLPNNLYVPILSYILPHIFARYFLRYFAGYIPYYGTITIYFTVLTNCFKKYINSKMENELTLYLGEYAVTTSWQSEAPNPSTGHSLSIDVDELKGGSSLVKVTDPTQGDVDNPTGDNRIRIGIVKGRPLSERTSQEARQFFAGILAINRGESIPGVIGNSPSEP